MTREGFVIAALAFVCTNIVIVCAGLMVAWRIVQEERAGTGCRRAGCRRSRPGNGCDQASAAESAGAHLHQRETD